MGVEYVDESRYQATTGEEREIEKRQHKLVSIIIKCNYNLYVFSKFNYQFKPRV
jgi:hypothetical protein